MFDIESLRNEKLIEERQNYENDFISIEDIIKSEELDYYTDPQFKEYFEETIESDVLNYMDNMDDFEETIESKFLNYMDNMDDFDYSFELEDRLMQKRDENLFECYKQYEVNYFKNLDFDSIVDNIFDYQINSFELDNFLEDDAFDYDDCEYDDFDYYEYEEEMFYHLLYLKKSQFELPSCSCPSMDYMPNDNGFCDYLDCFDYPEGPDENLCGVNYF